MSELHHRLDGPDDGPVLVLLPSLGTTLDVWAPCLPGWPALRVVRADLRGHGGSDVPRGPYSIDELARDVVELLDRLALRRVSFCGLSIGGAVAMSLAATWPERVDRLVLACTSARFAEPAFWEERARIVRRDGTAAVADVVVARWFTSHAPDELVARHRAMIAATPAEGYAACCDALAGWDFRGRLGAIRAETLVVAAADDPATPTDHAELLRHGIPSARLSVLGDAAHLAPVERPREFAALVAEHVGARAEEAA